MGQSIMTIDLIALTFILIYGYLGFHYGITGALINLTGMVGGYIAAVLYTKPVAVLLVRDAGLPGLLAYPAAGVLVFILTTRLFYILHLLVRRWMERNSEGPSPFIALDRVAGAGYGVLKGSVLVGFLLWGFPALMGSSSVAASVGLAQSQMVPLVQATVATITRLICGVVFDDSNAQEIIAQAIADPRSTSRSVTTLLSNSRIKGLVSDPQVQKAFQEKGLIGVLTTDQCGAVLADPQVQANLRELGISPVDGASISREEIYRCFIDLQKKTENALERLQGTVSNPQLAMFVQDPDVQERLKNGELMKVLGDPRLTQALGVSLETAKATTPKK